MKTMKMLTILVLALGLMVWSAEVSEAAPMGTAFTYQGRLIDANSAADGLYDFQFKVYDDPDRGSQQGSSVIREDVDVTDGYFTVELDFGSGVFDGNRRWLEVGVRPGASTGSFTTLSPRQGVTPTPYAIYAKTGGGTNTTWKVVKRFGVGGSFRNIVRDAFLHCTPFNGSLVYLNNASVEARRIDFFDAMPVSYQTIDMGTLASNVILIEVLEFSVARVEIGLCDGPSQGEPLEILRSDQFEFAIDGLGLLAHVLAVEPGAIVFDFPDPAPIGSFPRTAEDWPSSRPFAGLTFVFDPSGEVPDERWRTVSGGQMLFTVDHDVQIAFEDVELAGPFTYHRERNGLLRQLNEWLTDQSGLVDAAVALVDDEGRGIAINYTNVLPVAYFPPAVDKTVEAEALEEVFVFKAAMIESQSQ